MGIEVSRHDLLPLWVVTMPDGSVMETSELPTKDCLLEILNWWYSGKISKWKRMRNIAEYELVTGEKFVP